MSILQSLNRAYDRMALRHEVPGFGFSSQNISFVIPLNADGTIAGEPIDIRDKNGKKFIPVPMDVPAPPKRAAGIDPCFLWDKTSYVLGITNDEKKLKDDAKRLKAEHEAFKQFHFQALANSQDEGLIALQKFLRSWNPELFENLTWSGTIRTDLVDQNIAFAFEKERLERVFVHDRPAARHIWAQLLSESERAKAVCLITGENAPVARLHPSIKGVWGGQTGGGSIVSFNLDAFTSYGHEQGDNAPISEAAAFGYTTALNTFLAKGSHNRIQIGDASTVFWADASDVQDVKDAEAIFGGLFSEIDEADEARSYIKPLLENLRQGKSLKDLRPKLSKGVRFNVLGLAPNAARISIRFWYENDFGKLADDYRDFLLDMRIEPPDRDENVALWKYLRETAVLGKAENVQPNLAGDWMRAILTGGDYPLTLLTSVLMRIRSGGEVNAKRAATIKSILNRNYDWEVPVALDAESEDEAYVLGRLFAILEKLQTLSLGRVNAGIREKFYGSASANPRVVFPLLLRMNIHHQSKAEKTPSNKGLASYFAKQLAEVVNKLPAQFPASLSLQGQGKFALGYYHQLNRRKAAEEETIKSEGDAQ